MKLTAKLSLLLSGLAMAVLAGTLALLYFAERSHLLSQVEQSQVRDLGKLTRVCADTLLDDNELARLTYLKTYLASQEPGVIRSALLLDPAGQILMHSDFLAGDFSLKGATVAAAYLRRAAAEDSFLKQSITEGEATLLALSEPIRVQERRVGAVAILYDKEAVLRSVEQVQRESLFRFLQATVFGLGISILAAFLVARTLTRPIRELGLGAQKIGQGRLDYRIELNRKDELGDLSQEFNSMAQKLAELDELKDSFLAQITHDLRNPLGAIIGYVEMLLMGIQGPLSAEQAQSLQVVSRNGNYLSDLINNILDLTKLQAGRMEFSPKELALRPCAESVMELMQIKANEFKVRLDYSKVPASVSVWADEQALRRTLLNLVSNALKFTPEGGRVSLEWASLPSGEDRVSVRDTGIGIPADKLNTLFKKFAQIAETKNKVRESRGTGLGLVICKEIVESHGGRIWVESVYQRGTAFHFTLPKRKDAAAAPQEAHAA